MPSRGVAGSYGNSISRFLRSLYVAPCRGPAPVDPVNSKLGWSQHLGKDYLIRNIKRLGENNVVANLEEERGCIPWFTYKANKALRQGTWTVYIGPQAPTWIVEGALPCAPSHVGLRTPGKFGDMVSRYAPDGNQPENRVRKERRHWGTSLSRNWPILHGPENFLYFWLYIDINR